MVGFLLWLIEILPLWEDGIVLTEVDPARWCILQARRHTLTRQLLLTGKVFLDSRRHAAKFPNWVEVFGMSGALMGGTFDDKDHIVCYNEFFRAEGYVVWGEARGATLPRNTRTDIRKSMSDKYQTDL